MNYQEARLIAKDGDIFFINGTSILAKAVRWVTSSKFAHTGIFFWYGTRLMVIESNSPDGTRIVTGSFYNSMDFAIVSGKIDWKKSEDVLLEKSAKISYGWVSALYIGIRDVFMRRLNIKLPQMNNHYSITCGEFVADALGFEDNDLSPGELYKILTEK